MNCAFCGRDFGEQEHVDGGLFCNLDCALRHEKRAADASRILPDHKGRLPRSSTVRIDVHDLVRILHENVRGKHRETELQARMTEMVEEKRLLRAQLETAWASGYTATGAPRSVGGR